MLRAKIQSTFDLLIRLHIDYSLISMQHKAALGFQIRQRPLSGRHTTSYTKSGSEATTSPCVTILLLAKFQAFIVNVKINIAIIDNWESASQSVPAFYPFSTAQYFRPIFTEDGRWQNNRDISSSLWNPQPTTVHFATASHPEAGQ